VRETETQQQINQERGCPQSSIARAVILYIESVEPRGQLHLSQSLLQISQVRQKYILDTVKCNSEDFVSSLNISL